MTETLDQLRARRRKDKAIQRKAEARRNELAAIGAAATEAHLNPSEQSEEAVEAMIKAFIERVGR